MHAGRYSGHLTSTGIRTRAAGKHNPQNVPDPMVIQPATPHMASASLDLKDQLSAAVSMLQGDMRACSLYSMTGRHSLGAALLTCTCACGSR